MSRVRVSGVLVLAVVAAGCGESDRGAGPVAETSSGGAPASGGGTSTGGLGSTGGAFASGGSGGTGRAPLVRPTAPDLPAGWSPRVEFSPPSGTVATVPEMVMDSSGTAHVVIDGRDLWVAPFDAEGWGDPFTLDESYASGDTQVAINDADQVVVVWDAASSATSAALAARFTPESGWVPGEPLGSTAADVDDIDVAVSSTGRALAVWLEGRDSGSFIVSALFDGTSWSTPVDVAPSEFGSLVRPAVGIDDAGRGVAIWRVTDDGTVLLTSCGGAVFDGANWSAPTRVSGADSGCYLPDLAMRGSGEALAVYEYDYDLYALRYTTEGGWETGTDIGLPEDNSTYAAAPELAFDGQGNALVLWREDVTGNSQYTPMFNRYDAATGWTEPVALAEPGPQMNTSARLAVNTGGAAIAAWLADEADGFRSLYATRYTPGVGFEPTFVVDAGLDDGNDPDVAIDAAGNVAIVWERRDDVGTRVFATYRATE